MGISKVRITSKGKERLIKQDMTSNVDSVGGRIKADITFGEWRIAKKNARFRPGLQFMLVKRPKVWITSTPKSLESMKRWWL